MSRKIKRSDCVGCYKEYYHQSGLTCWDFSDATLSLGRKQHKDTLPKNYKGRFSLIPDCYTYQCGFIERHKEEREE